LRKNASAVGRVAVTIRAVPSGLAREFHLRSAYALASKCRRHAG